jgi:hypothetical protein
MKRSCTKDKINLKRAEKKAPVRGRMMMAEKVSRIEAYETGKSKVRRGDAAGAQTHTQIEQTK